MVILIVFALFLESVYLCDMFGSQTNIKTTYFLTEAFLILAQLDQASQIIISIMINNNHEATLVLTRVKRYLQGNCMKEPVAIVVLYLNMIDEVITYIEPDADINVLCDEVRLQIKS